MAELRIEVFGQPAPQGSKRAFVSPKTGRAHVIESSHDRVRSWRQAVLEATRHAIDTHPGNWTVTGPVELTIIFHLPRPKSHYRTGRYSHVLRDSAPLWPAGTPDLSKLIRSTEDALTDAGAWADDAQVVHYADTWKAYTSTSTEPPGAEITIRELSDD